MEPRASNCWMRLLLCKSTPAPSCQESGWPLTQPRELLSWPCLLPGLPAERLISCLHVTRPARPQAVLRAALGSALWQTSPPHSQLADSPWAPEPHGPVVDPLAVAQGACPDNEHTSLGAWSTEAPKHTDSALLRKLTLSRRKARRLGLLYEAVALHVHAGTVLPRKRLAPCAAQRTA